MKQASKALGGEKSLQKIVSWQKKGSITRARDGVSGTFQMQAAQPNFYNESYDLNGFEKVVGYNGKSGWVRDSRDGLRTLTGKASNHFKAEAAFRNLRWLNYRKEKSKITFGGQTDVNGRSANIVNLPLSMLGKTSLMTAHRSSTENIGFLSELFKTAITISSNKLRLRPMISRCPFVKGSKEPGKIARRIILVQSSKLKISVHF